MSIRLPANIASAMTLPMLLLLGSQHLAAQPQSLPGQSSPGLNDAPLPALLTSNPLNQVLPADRAFALQLQPLDDTTRLALHFDIAPGYYLYRQSLKISTPSGSVLVLELPPGETIEDEYFGKSEVYYGQLDAQALAAPATATATATATANDDSLLLFVEYQGCAAERYCYPPQRKELLLQRP